MADNLTDGAEARVLNFCTGNTPATAPTLPLMVRLMTANGSDSTAGTEVTGGSYTAQSVAFPAASGTTSTANSADVVFNSMPAVTVVGIEIWDSAGTPFRWWWGAATASKTTNAGDTLRILAGQLTLSMQ